MKDSAQCLAMGSYRLAERYGHPELSMSVKKQEMPAYDGRAMQGIGLEYATSNRGGCHVRGYMIAPEVLGLPVKIGSAGNRRKGLYAEGIPGSYRTDRFCRNLPVHLICHRTARSSGAVPGGSGSDESDADILLKGERVWNLEKKFNIAAGVEKDTLPPRL